MNPGHSGTGGTPVAPFDDLNDLLPIAFKDSFHASVPSILNPALQAKLFSHFLSVKAEKDTLNRSLNDHMGPCVFYLHFSSPAPGIPSAEARISKLLPTVRA